MLTQIYVAYGITRLQWINDIHSLETNVKLKPGSTPDELHFLNIVTDFKILSTLHVSKNMRTGAEVLKINLKMSVFKRFSFGTIC